MSILEYILSILELALFYSLMILIDENNKIKTMKLLFLFIVVVLMLSVLNYFDFSYYMLFTFGLIFLIYIALNRRNVLFLITDLALSCVLISFIQLVFMYGLSFIDQEISENSYLQASIMVGFTILTNLLRIKINMDYKFLRFYKNNRTIFLLSGAGIFIVIILISNIYNKNEALFYQEKITLILFFLAFLVISIVLFVVIARVLIVSNQNKMFFAYDKYLGDIIQKQQQKDHDTNGHFTALLAMAEEIADIELKKRILNYVKQVINENDKISISGITDNTVIASFLRYTKENAKDMGVDFTCDIDKITPEYDIPETKLMELLSNLFTNAIEETKRPDISKKRKNVLVLFENDKISISNPTHKGFSNEDMEFYLKGGNSTKGKDRGFGMTNISSIAQKYNIQMEYEIENEEITFTFIFNTNK